MVKETQTLDELKNQALALMEKAGYRITKDVEVTLDEKLGFMGYTTQKEGNPIIVVSGRAFSSGGALNLLIHELSHVYRSQEGHPSHDYQLLTAITAWVMHGKIVTKFQEKILSNIINIIQDLYADDISFKIFAQTSHPENLNEFFMSWIHAPVKPTSAEHIWTNAEYLLDAAFAKSNLERHTIPDFDGKIENALKEFLSHLDQSQAEKFDYFEKFMVRLPEKVTEKEFEKLLIEYLSAFLKLT